MPTIYNRPRLLLNYQSTKICLRTVEVMCECSCRSPRTTRSCTIHCHCLHAGTVFRRSGQSYKGGQKHILEHIITYFPFYNPKNFSRCHSYLRTLVGAPSATALLQHEIQFLLPLQIVPPYTVSSTTSSLTSQPSSLTINILCPATWRLPAPPIHA